MPVDSFEVSESGSGSGRLLVDSDIFLVHDVDDVDVRTNCWGGRGDANGRWMLDLVFDYIS